MKKTLTLLFAALCTISASAQLSNGFYRVQNTLTDRYISIEDNDPANYKVSITTSSVPLTGIRTHKPGTKVMTSPSTIIYVRSAGGNQYDLEGQGTGIYKISGGRLYASLDQQSDGSYKGYGTFQKTTVVIADDEIVEKEEAYLRNRSADAQYWWIKPVNDGTNYLGIAPDVEVDGKYYGTIYAGFAFKLASSGMKAYYVSEAAGSGFSMEEISGEVPANTPVIVECSSNDPANNKILPVTSNAATISGNHLYGVYCSLVTTKSVNGEIYNSSTRRTLGKSDGKLAFVQASSSDLYEGTYLRGNKAYLMTGSGDSDVMTLGGSTAISNVKAEAAKDKGTYTLTGVRIPDDVTPRPGIYIKNGKKIVVK
ncbi:MAG: hypothetical protein IJ067_02595 [Prevotella sp.]|nr:hypothetical protein [Prevotella sp.]